MIVLDVKPKDIHVTIEYSLKEISMLLDFLDHCEMEYNGEDEPEMKEVEKYITEEFFPKHNQVVDDIMGNKDGIGPNS